MAWSVPASIHAGQVGANPPVKLAQLGIEVLRGTSREVAYTNKEAGVYYTESNAAHRSAWQGWRIMSTEVMETYGITLDGRRLSPAEASRTTVYPHQFVREYSGGIRETVTLLDSLDAVIVGLEGVHGRVVEARPFFADARSGSDYLTADSGRVLLVAHKSHRRRTAAEDYPVWIGMAVAMPSAVVTIAQGPDTMGQAFSPAALRCRLGGQSGRGVDIIIVAGDTREMTVALARRVARDRSRLVAQRIRRMERLLNASYVRTDNPRLDKALCWAKLSVDALIMHQRKKGIFAGLPWFDNYWGRDSFISLPGATLVTGRFEDAREILQSFAQWQDTNATSPNYGRIPNLVTPTSIAYNTADGTPRFIAALYDYYRYTGDSSFLRRMYPVVRRSIEGTLRYHADTLSFLVHGDAETWMDAVGPEGPWSPRGNRANDIQELWCRQLEDAAMIARIVAPWDATEADRWRGIAERVRANFNRVFLDTAAGLLYDCLKPDGSPDAHLRPNQLFACELIGDERLRESVLRQVTARLVYPYGIASLSQDDEDFHPYHHHSPYYVQDAAYHNGTVWTWLAGKWIDLMADEGMSDLAFKVTGNMVDQILGRGAVGTLSELLDAVPHPGDSLPRLSGAYSQAWSLAEFIRAFYQSYLGVAFEGEAGGNTVTISPALPSAISRAHFTVWYGATPIECDYRYSGGGGRIALSAGRAAGAIPFRFVAHPGENPAFTDTMIHGARVDITVSTDSAAEMNQGNHRRQTAALHRAFRSPLEGLSLATPEIHPGLRALRGPSYPLLSNSDVKVSNRSARILYDAADPEGDDTGSGGYTYPTTVNLKPGSLDITHFTVLRDDKNLYVRLQFRALSNPGWHPEYGFQLTYAAIAIDKQTGSTSRDVGMNSRYTFGPDFGIDEIIYVGGGLRIVDSKGGVLAEYLPAPGDEKDPLGNAKTATVGFSIPLSFIGNPDSTWRYAVLVGCQDDHGGAGIGEFRSVEAEAKEWVGGGKRDPNGPNVYDAILPKSKGRK